jgi:TonB family protein
MLRTEPFSDADFQPAPNLIMIDETPATIAGTIVRGSIVSKVNPIYPARAKANHVSGTVILDALIGIDGRIHSLKIHSAPDPDLAVAAIAAVRQWVYTPYRINGRPKRVQTTVTFSFRPA